MIAATPVSGPSPSGARTVVGAAGEEAVPMPRCPLPPAPHVTTCPFDSSAIDRLPAAAMLATPPSSPVRPSGACTGTGTALGLLVPLPSCPLLLAPQATTRPSSRRASECRSPAARAFTSVSVPLPVGERTGPSATSNLSALRPSWPKSSSPTLQTSPDVAAGAVGRGSSAEAVTPPQPAVRARQRAPAAAGAAAVRRDFTGAGREACGRAAQ
ncbi:hypothetical protein BJF79_47295 [Actinomadura sp. CNU-125]|nr:hypothetical protein [Actinomadura sp. CNU-125]OLT20437.1 hypothetical protein BJF79_47295 [Actinomadura sp. CNU-125]